MIYTIFALLFLWVAVCYSDRRSLRRQIKFLEQLCDDYAADEAQLNARIEELEGELFNSCSKLATLRADIRGFAKQLTEESSK